MTTHQLICELEKMGAEFQVSEHGVSIVPPLMLTGATQARFQKLFSRVRENSLLVVAWLREREASRRWEASGRDPGWWRQ